LITVFWVFGLVVLLLIPLSSKIASQINTPLQHLILACEKLKTKNYEKVARPSSTTEEFT
jgi:hypothetical protein